MHKHSVPIKTIDMLYKLLSRNRGNYKMGNLRAFQTLCIMWLLWGGQNWPCLYTLGVAVLWW